MNRRSFLGSVAAATAGVTLPVSAQVSGRYLDGDVTGGSEEVYTNFYIKFVNKTRTFLYQDVFSDIERGCLAFQSDLGGSLIRLRASSIPFGLSGGAYEVNKRTEEMVRRIRHVLKKGISFDILYIGMDRKHSNIEYAGLFKNACGSFSCSRVPDSQHLINVDFTCDRPISNQSILDYSRKLVDVIGGRIE